MRHSLPTLIGYLLWSIVSGPVHANPQLEEAPNEAHRERISIPTSFSLLDGGLVDWEATGEIFRERYGLGAIRSAAVTFGLGVTGMIAVEQLAQGNVPPNLLNTFRTVYPVGLALGTYLRWRSNSLLPTMALLREGTRITPHFRVPTEPHLLPFHPETERVIDPLVSGKSLAFSTESAGQARTWRAGQAKSVSLVGTINSVEGTIRVDRDRSAVELQDGTTGETTTVPLTNVKPLSFCSRFFHQLGM